MITQIKTALLGDEARTDDEERLPSRSGTDADDTRAVPDVSEIDPFRPAADLAEGANHDHVKMDQIFGILGNQRRRYVLKYLSMNEGTITISDLTEQIAAWECKTEIAQLDSQERKRVYVSLYQCHLPKMADVSAISYDKRRGEIEEGKQFDSFSHYLRHAE